MDSEEGTDAGLCVSVLDRDRTARPANAGSTAVCGVGE
jgi:hypothetical protein